MPTVRRRKLKRRATIKLDRETCGIVDNILIHAQAIASGNTRYTTREYVVGRAVRLLASMTGAPSGDPSKWAAMIATTRCTVVKTTIVTR